jgi:hypothetical protein
VEFSLLGGPLHRLGCRLGLVRQGCNTLPLGLALGLATWSVLVLLALLEGRGRQLFSLAVLAGHARLLLAVPLFFLCETFLEPRVRQFVEFMVSSGIVPQSALPALQLQIARVRRSSDSAWLCDVPCLVLAVLLSLAAPRLHLPGATAAYDSTHGAAGFSMAGWWYWAVALVLFRFLLLRWLWRIALWCYFLFRVSRLELRLIPTHPDKVAGLGILENAQVQFTPLILAISVVEAASFAEGLSQGLTDLTAIYPQVGLILILDALLFIGPVLFFWPALLACRANGLLSYMGLASQYVSDFDRKWRGATTPTEPLLGTPDLQSLADLSNSVRVIEDMTWAPISRFMLISYAAAALLPMVPLLLFKYPLEEVAKQLLRHLVAL